MDLLLWLTDFTPGITQWLMDDDTPLDDEDAFTVREFLTAWLHHYHYLPANQRLRPDLRLVEDLDLNALARLEMVVDVETFYGIRIPDAAISALATVRDVEKCLRYQRA